MQGDFGSIVIENVDLRQTKANYTYTEPFLFRIAGRHQSLVLRDIKYFNPTDDRYLIHLEGRTDIPDMGDTPAVVDSLVIDGLHIQNQGDAAQTRPYIRVSGHVGHMVVRNSEVLDTKGNHATFLATVGEHAGIDCLVLQDICTRNLGCLVFDPQNKIKQLVTSNVTRIEPAAPKSGA